MVKLLLAARADVEQPVAGATPLQYLLDAPSLEACHLGAPRVELCLALIADGATTEQMGPHPRTLPSLA